MDTELGNVVSGSWNILEEVQKVIQDNKVDVFLKKLNGFVYFIGAVYFSILARWLIDFGHRLGYYQFLDLSCFSFF